MGFHSRTLEESKGKIYLQPPKGPKHDRSKQGKKGEFARLSSVLSQQSGSRAQAEREGARATRAKGSKKPAPKRLVKPCASPLHPRETQSTPAESGWTQSVREELQGDDSALSALAVMESFDEQANRFRVAFTALSPTAHFHPQGNSPRVNHFRDEITRRAHKTADQKNCPAHGTRPRQVEVAD